MNQLTLDDFKDRLISFSNDIYNIPDDFAVHEDYLQGIPKNKFIEAYKEYRNIMMEMYRHAAISPIDYGFSLISRKTGEEKLYDDFKSTLTYREKLIQVHCFLNRICVSSIINNNVLIVDVIKLKKYINTFPKIKKTDVLIQRLRENGFEFTGYQDKLKSTNSLSITYSKNKYLMNVMKRISESKYSKIGVEYDYAHFNYNVLTIGKDECLPLTDLFVFNSLSSKTQYFLINFNSSMNKLGYSYGDSATSGYCWENSQFAYSKNPEKKKDYVCRLYQRSDKLVDRLYLKNIDSYSDYIESAPDFIKDSFINNFGKCFL